ncbi:UDP-N-acetylmuramoyl-L-alanine--D-glutamate ligase [Neomicrococcus aestuarii]|uniref:UDP-N-acetylmuramoyl-L-alanine--D-glutamate ligase n=1 Tax=Neomicrococcus aestuarii TaxID=556325 RepID=UPI00160DED02|nr:UDP-N-acetylmuramoyl-L-alanine--D-glutamate ligase [Neomicrococcus aestuarii]
MACWTVTNLDELTSWDANWRGVRVLVTGLGVTGFSVADTLIELGATVVVVDGSTSELVAQRADTLKIVGAHDVLLGSEHLDSLPLIDGAQPDVVVTSPGWNPRHPVLAAATEAGIPIWGDIEVAWRVRERAGRTPAEWLVLTGTNGKTTTVEMTASILRAAGKRAIAVGNVGTPILDAIRDPQGYDVFAIELSSFQLHYTHTMSPLASAVLNLAEDHVDWHGSIEEYFAAKAKIYERTRAAVIYNVEQRETEKMVEEADVVDGCRAIGFTTGIPGLSMLGVVEGLLVDRAFIEERRSSAAELASLSDLGEIVPQHTAANALAAAALCRAYGVSAAAVKQGLSDFEPGDHRIQVIASKDGVTWINDSKATNPHAASASLSAFKSIVWVAGGLPKGVEYDELVLKHRERLRAVVLIGADSSKLAESLARHAPDVPVIGPGVQETGSEATEQGSVEQRSSSGEDVMRQAVAAAASVAQDGDTVLMAPAAASMDQFQSYAHRGNAFVQAVQDLLR